MSDAADDEYYEMEAGDDDGNDDGFAPQETGTPTFDRPTGPPKPLILTPEAVLSRIDSDVTAVANILNWSRASALLLLRHFKWHVDMVNERYYDDPEGVMKMAKVESFEQDDLELSSDGGTCGLCWDDFIKGQGAALSCKHYFCLGCWTTHLTWELNNSGTNSIAARCPQGKCMHICGQESFDKVLKLANAKEALLKYQRYLIRAFSTENDRFAQCVAPDCTFVIQYPTPRAQIEAAAPSVKCECGAQFCFRCFDDAHGPCSCDNLKLWKKKEQDESETANWVAANTKQCPNRGCGKAIEKNGGCNHMVCPSCKYDWCWVCEGAWEKHGSSWYKCNYFDSSKKDNNEDARAKAKTELQRYLHYYTRYRNHEQSKKLDKKVLQKTRDRIAKQLQATQVPLFEVEYLEKTATVLINCRHTLMYTYAYAYYLDDGRDKELFEYHQCALELATERLSEFIEDTKSKYEKQEIVNRTSTAEKMLTNLQEGCLKTG